MTMGSANGVRLELHASHQLDRTEQVDGWQAVGNDPQFVCETAGLPLAAGWYKVDLELEQLAGTTMWPFFYPDYGVGLIEGHNVFLPFVEAGARQHSGIVRFTHDVRFLRFDPATVDCEFRIGELRVRRVGRLTAALMMLKALMKRARPAQTKLRQLASLAKRTCLGGPSAFAEWLYSYYAERPQMSFSAPYRTWVELYDAVTPQRVARAQAEIASMPQRPRFSIVMPAYNSPEHWLRKCVASVRAQHYPDWELCIANDASPAPHVRRLLDELAASDARIKVIHRPDNGHISAASNSALEIASGEWIVLLDHDDELHPLALFELARATNQHPQWRLIYTDEDKIDTEGRRYDPYMKPDWNYDLFLSHNCISHLGAYSRDLVRDVGGFRVGLEGSQDWDLALRCIEQLKPEQIGHVAKVLYHWRAIPGSTALAAGEKNYAHEAGLRAVREHLQRINSAGSVEEIPGRAGNFRIRYTLPTPAPLVSIIVPTRDRLGLLKACVDSLLQHTVYPNYEVLIVDNQSAETKTLDYFDRVVIDPRIRVLRYDAPFNYSSINNFAAEHARGDVFCLLNNDITVISPDWLDEMVGHALRPGIGAVGAMLYYPNDTIQHAGVVLGVHGVAAHAYSGRPRGDIGHMGRAALAQQLSAVTAACLVVTREAFESVAGLDPRLEVAFNDIDFCLRLLERGYRNVWTPFAELYHHESASRGLEDSPEKVARFNREVDYMRERWGGLLDADPTYSPNCTISDFPYELAFPPRLS